MELVNGKIPTYWNRDSDTIHVIEIHEYTTLPLTPVGDSNVLSAEGNEEQEHTIVKDVCGSGFRPEGGFRGDEIEFIEPKYARIMDSMCSHCKKKVE